MGAFFCNCISFKFLYLPTDNLQESTNVFEAINNLAKPIFMICLIQKKWSVFKIKGLKIFNLKTTGAQLRGLSIARSQPLFMDKDK